MAVGDLLGDVVRAEPLQELVLGGDLSVDLDVDHVERVLGENLSLPPVDGLDIESGLHRVAGKMTLYVTLLRKFVNGQKHIPEDISKALDDGELNLGERLSHTLKGVSGNIGAVDVETASAMLEQSIRERRPEDEIQNDLKRLREKLKYLVEMLEPILQVENSEPATTTDPEAVKTTCDRLLQLLTESDPQALDVLQEQASLLRSAFPRHYAALERRIQDFDFDSAVEILGKARDEKTSSRHS